MREEIGLLKDGLNDLRRELKDLKESSSRAQQEEACLYVRLQNYLPKHINKAVLETLLQSSIKSYIIISKSSPTVCKVRIASQHLHTALNAGLTIEGTTIRPWLPKSLSLKLPMCGTTPTLAKSSTYGTLRITTWNARGLRSGEPYLCHLANTMSDVIVATEHWLWPFEAHRLAKVNKEFHAETVTDSRLTESSSLNHGCGGVGILWKKSHDAVPISGIQSDRICGIRIQLSSTPLQCLTILGVYLPCADQGMQVYCDHLVELERLVTEAQQYGLVMVLGDFNAHLGHLGGSRGSGSAPNPQGLIVKEWADRCHLYAVSMSALATGPVYTYFSGDKKTVVDYIFADAETAQHLKSCCVHDMHGLNTSDHLPVTAVLSLQATQSTEKTNTQSPINWEQSPINWEKAISIGGLKLYQDRLGEVTSNCIGREYPCIDELDAEIEQVSQSIIKAAEMLPRYKPPRGRKKWYSDATLSRLSKEKKEAWDTWKAEGRPASGPVHEQKIRTREEVRKRIRVCEANEERSRLIRNLKQEIKQPPPYWWEDQSGQ